MSSSALAAIDRWPVAVIGAGPVGLAAAAHLLRRGLRVRVYEAGDVGAHIQDWRHVSLFSPWRYNIDEEARTLLTARGWAEPHADDIPTGGELLDRYLRPLAETPELARVIETGARVEGISRQGADKVLSRDRELRPFVLHVRSKEGRRRDFASAVIDASGTWSNPNPLGADGLPAAGERENADRIHTGIPDVLGRDREAFVGAATLVVGAGHSAANVLLDLQRLAGSAQQAELTWAVRGSDLTRVFGGGADDALAARGDLGSRLRAFVDSGRIRLVTGFAVADVHRQGSRLSVLSDDGKTIGPFDRIVVATGQRPDWALTRELRLDLDPSLESARALGPLIDPNQHSCGSVPPHGHRELAQPEPGYYAVGIKSYGRAPTFLMLTGYEQVRSVAAAIAGDHAAADDVRLVLPETGACSSTGASASPAGCCGGPAPSGVDACCVADALAKDAGRSGCGCAA